MQNDNIWEKALLSLDATVEDGIKSLEESGLQICLVVDKNKNFGVRNRWRYKTVTFGSKKPSKQNRYNYD